jgi:uncharacterized protein involved in response to NO
MSQFQITADTMIPDLLRLYPQSRPVFDQYGLQGCGGPLGPHETIGFFARAHDVSLAKLLDELQQSLRQTPSMQQLPVLKAELADRIYRLFFIGAIFFVLTAGASWGAWLLWSIAMQGSFATAPVLDVNAHAQAQVFGWVGLMVMGFACQAFPRFWHTRLWKPELAVMAFCLMSAGIISVVFALSFDTSWKVPLALAGAVLELAATTVFLVQIFATFKQSGQPSQMYVVYIMTALFFFCVSAAVNLIHTGGLVLGGIDVSSVQWILRDLQFHGFALLIILGVSLRTLPHLFGLPAVKNGHALLAFLLLSFAVISEAVLYFAYSHAVIEPGIEAMMLPWVFLTCGVVALLSGWRIWRPFPEAERSNKFVQAAFLWLVISLLMLLLSPVSGVSASDSWSHAYFGAIRHAFTVGFVTLMIMGYAARITATLNGLNTAKLSKLMLPFILINAGCLTRVSLQVASDYFPTVIKFIGISGVMEVTALTIWGWHIAATIFNGAQEQKSSCLPPKPEPISAETHVYDVIYWYPDSIDIFLSFGLNGVANPVLRETVTKHVNLGTACRMHGIDVAQLVAELNRLTGKEQTNCTGCSGQCH